MGEDRGGRGVGGPGVVGAGVRGLLTKNGQGAGSRWAGGGGQKSEFWAGVSGKKKKNGAEVGGLSPGGRGSRPPLSSPTVFWETLLFMSNILCQISWKGHFDAYSLFKACCCLKMRKTFTTNGFFFVRI